MKLTNPVKNLKWALYPLGDITQWYGENKKLYSKIGLEGHNGIDIIRPWGEHLFAIADGVICDLKDDPEGYGKHIRILEDVGGGEYREWTYGHLSHINVKLGDTVKAGQYVGNMGNTGFVVSNATGNGFWEHNPYKGTHLHLTLRRTYKSATGWQYPMGGVKVHVRDYNNGFKGGINPLPFFLPPNLLSSKIISIASATQDKTLFLFGQLLIKIGM